MRQHFAVDGYLIKPISEQSLWDVLQQFGESVETILIMDDNQDFVRLLRRLLDNRVRKYHIMTAYSGQEGLTRMRHRTPDLILLDLNLPDMDGLDVIKKIRSSSTWQQIPIVVVSARDEIDNFDTLQGDMLVSKADGLMPGEVVQWIQHLLANVAITKPEI